MRGRPRGGAWSMGGVRSKRWTWLMKDTPRRPHSAQRLPTSSGLAGAATISPSISSVPAIDPSHSPAPISGGGLISNNRNPALRHEQRLACLAHSFQDRKTGRFELRD